MPASNDHDEFVSAFASTTVSKRRTRPWPLGPVLAAALLTFGAGAMLLPDSPLRNWLDELGGTRQGTATAATIAPRYNPFTHEGTRELLRYQEQNQAKRQLMVPIQAHAVPNERLIAENTIDSEETRARLRWQFGQTLRHLAATQQDVENYYRQHADWPSRETAPFFKLTESAYIKSVELRGSGELLAGLSADFGRHGQVRMTPEKPDSLGHFRWHCMTNVPLSIELSTQAATACRYNPYAF